MDGEVSLKISLDTKSFDKQIKKLETELSEMEKEYNNLTELSSKGIHINAKQMENLASKIEKTKNQIISLKDKQAELNQQGMPNIKNVMSDIGQETSNVLKKVAKWGLAIFSVRSAYMFVRQAVSTLSQYNEKIGTDIQYIRFALASSLQPLIEGIIKLVYKLLAYINYIAKAWFGVNLFANASAKAFQKVNKGVKDTNKSAKQLSKTLLGFDEMNILQKDGTTSVGGGGGGITAPSMDLSNMNVEIPGWIKWIAENGELLKNIIIGIGQAFLTWKLLQWASELGVFAGGIGQVATMLKVAGIVAIVIGISEAIKDIIKLIIDPNWNTFYSLIGDFSLALLGLSGILIAINASNPLGWITLGISAIGLFVAALGKDEEQTLSAKDATNQLKDAKEKLNQVNNRYVSALENAKKSSKELAKAEKDLQKATGDHTLTGEKLFASVLIGTKTVDNMTEAELAVYKAYLNNESAQKNLNDTNKELNEVRKESIDKAEQEAAAVFKETGQYNEYFKAIIDGYNNKKISESEMLSATANIYSRLDEESKKTFAQSLPDSIKKAIDSHSQFVEVLDNGTEIPFREISKNSKKTFETDVPNSVQKSINKVDALTNSIEKLRKKGNVKVNISTTTSSSSTGMKTGGILKLASGAVINNPGRGVPLRSDVRGGEAGREGIVPLTDQQAMSQLGYEIGRNVVVAPTIPVYVGTRLVAKETRKINAEEQFAFNG